MNGWACIVYAHALRVGAFFLMLVACVQVNECAGDRANTCSVRTLRTGGLMACEHVAWPLSSMIGAYVNDGLAMRRG